MSNELMIVRNEGLSVEQAIRKYSDMTEYIKSILKEGIDYGTVPNAGSKPALFKAGAEKLLSKFQYRPEFTILNKIEDWKEGFFYYHYIAKR